MYLCVQGENAGAVLIPSFPHSPQLAHQQILSAFLPKHIQNAPTVLISTTLTRTPSPFTWLTATPSDSGLPVSNLMTHFCPPPPLPHPVHFPHDSQNICLKHRLGSITSLSGTPQCLPTLVTVPYKPLRDLDSSGTTPSPSTHCDPAQCLSLQLPSLDLPMGPCTSSLPFNWNSLPPSVCRPGSLLCRSKLKGDLLK